MIQAWVDQAVRRAALAVRKPAVVMLADAKPRHLVVHRVGVDKPDAREMRRAIETFLLPTLLELGLVKPMNFELHVSAAKNKKSLETHVVLWQEENP